MTQKAFDKIAAGLMDATAIARGETEPARALRASEGKRGKQMKTLEQALAELPEPRRKRIEENAQKLIEDERVLRLSREARRLTQKTPSDALRVDQARIPST